MVLIWHNAHLNGSDFNNTCYTVYTRHESFLRKQAIRKEQLFTPVRAFSRDNYFAYFSLQKHASWEYCYISDKRSSTLFQKCKVPCMNALYNIV